MRVLSESCVRIAIVALGLLGAFAEPGRAKAVELEFVDKKVLHRTYFAGVREPEQFIGDHDIVVARSFDERFTYQFLAGSLGGARPSEKLRLIRFFGGLEQSVEDFPACDPDIAETGRNDLAAANLTLTAGGVTATYQARCLNENGLHRGWVIGYLSWNALNGTLRRGVIEAFDGPRRDLAFESFVHDGTLYVLTAAVRLFDQDGRVFLSAFELPSFRQKWQSWLPFRLEADEARSFAIGPRPQGGVQVFAVGDFARRIDMAQIDADGTVVETKRDFRVRVPPPDGAQDPVLLRSVTAADVATLRGGDRVLAVRLQQTPRRDEVIREACQPLGEDGRSLGRATPYLSAQDQEEFSYQQFAAAKLSVDGAVAQHMTAIRIGPTIGEPRHDLRLRYIELDSACEIVTRAVIAADNVRLLGREDDALRGPFYVYPRDGDRLRVAVPTEGVSRSELLELEFRVVGKEQEIAADQAPEP
ncbi:hypothetical protein [Hansschlegelia zhihuaiae]|uniref:Uncharacterized protein n=1 Tax=Hansschlegelia zhihuaiae TaxID=405005 RepID=A0A4Q0MJW1_9HYPH|nr:hypothetical protein [Hansschlegelia zhihuaiae]RXF73864.1 hypothetical protein EK403_07765 [Hansschlegelia zhihuaiae]